LLFTNRFIEKGFAFFDFLGPFVKPKALEIDRLPLELKKCLKGTKMRMEP
jgi:hypothetical protein